MNIKHVTMLLMVLPLILLLAGPLQAETFTYLFGTAEDTRGSLEKLFKKTRTEVCSKTDPAVGLDYTLDWARVKEQRELKTLEIDKIEKLRLLGHANLPIKVLMVCATQTVDEVQGMFEAIKAINESENLQGNERLKLHLIASHATSLKGLRVSQDDFDKYVEVNRYFGTRDIWMQDWGEVATVMAEGADKERTVVFDSNRGRGLDGLPQSLSRMWNAHYAKTLATSNSCGNYGGNIEVTPDDILYLGDTATPKHQEFFARAGYADRMAVLETAWLTVGHVDEYVSTLCSPDSDLGYTIVKADPRRAMELLKEMKPDQVKKSLANMVRSFYHFYPMFPDAFGGNTTQLQMLILKLGTMYEALNSVNLAERDAATALIKYNEEVAEIIDRNIEVLKAKIREVRGADVKINVVGFPSLFDKISGKACATLPGVVNMVVLRKHLVIPDPLMPEIREDIRKTCEKLGYKCQFVANASYHFSQGQLHCGSNVFRHPNKYVHPRYEKLRTTNKFDRLHQ